MSDVGTRVALCDVRKTYGTAPSGTGRRPKTGMANRGVVTALAGITMDVDPGRFVVLLGPSGSGKSTLARVLAGIERIDTGMVRLAGVTADDGRRHLPPERRNLAMVFQDYALWPHMTAASNVEFALRRRRLGKGTARQRTLAALDRVGLSHLAGCYPQELSGGEQQRVALARAVVAEPGLLIFDEPLSNLDADLRERLRIEIATLTREIGATAVYITHDQAEAFALADDVGVLHNGQLVQFDSAEAIYQRPSTPFVARFTGVAGEFRGTVVTREGDQSTIDVAGHQVASRSTPGLRAGDDAEVFVRPAAVRFCAVAGAGLRGSETIGSLPGVVVDIAYRGRGYEHVVQTDCGRLTGVFADLPRARGSNVRVQLAAEGCHAYPPGAAPQVGDRYDVDLTVVTPRVRSTTAELVLEGESA